MKLLLKLIYLQLKRTAKLFPAIILSGFVFMSLLAAIGFGLFKYYNSGSSLIKSRVAVVTGDLDESISNKGLEIVSNMDSFSDSIEFIITDANDASNMLKNGDVIAIMTIPSDIYNTIMSNSDSTPVYITFNSENPLSNVFLTETTGSLSRIIFSAEAAGTVLNHLYNELSFSSEKQSAYNNLDIMCLKYATRSDDTFHNLNNRLENEDHLISFILSAGIILFMMLIQGAFSTVFSMENSVFFEYCKKEKFFYLRLYTANLVTLFITDSILLSIIIKIISVIFKDRFKISVMANLIPIMLIALFIALITMIFYSISKKNYNNIIISFFATLLLMMTGGLIIPEILLPNTILKLMPFNPFSVLRNIFSVMISNNMLNINTCLIMTSALFFISYCFGYIKYKR